MNNGKLSVALIFGGASNEYEVSCVSAAFAADNIDSEKYDVYKIGITKSGKWFVYEGDAEKMRDLSWCDNNDNLIPAVISPCTVQHGIFIFNKAEKTFETLRIDVAFPLIHGAYGEDGTLQGLLKMGGIPFVGCDTYSSAVCFDKRTAKIICERAGVKTAKWVSALKDSVNIENFITEAENSLKYPMFVKPANCGSSNGVSKVKNSEELEKALETAFAFDGKVIVEEGVDGAEIEVAVFDDGKDVIVSVCGEIQPGSEFYDYNDKYVNGITKYFIPARINDGVAADIREQALKIFRLLDCSSLSRVDFLVTENEIFFNEINTIPGLTPISMYPKLMEYCGVGAKELFERLIDGAIRFER